MRRWISTVLVGLLVASSVAAAAPGDVRSELSPPAGQTAVKVGDRLNFGGEVPPGSDPQARLDALAPGGSVLQSYDVSSRVTTDAGVVGGGVTVGCFYVPGCIDATTEAERDAAFDALGGYTLTLTVAAVSDTSNKVDFDDEPPIMLGYELISTTTVRVLFSEDVFDPENDSALDWEVDGDRTAVTSVSGTGNSRILTLRAAVDRNATPEVRYVPVPSPNPNVPNRPYVDGARNELDAANRLSEAKDRIPPPVPSIAQVDGGAVAYESDDLAIPVLGSDTTPDVTIDNVPIGATAQLYLDDGDGRFELDQDTLVGSADGTQSKQVTITVDRVLPDAVHRFYAQSIDTAECDPNDPASGTCPNRSGRSDEARYDLETVPPTPIGDALGRSSTISLLFSESIAGADDAGQWSVSNLGGGAVTVTAVGGSGTTRTLQFTGGPLVPPTATVTYTPPASNAYADEHGNQMAAFTIDIVAADLPVLDVTPGEVEEGNAPGGPLPSAPPTLDFTLTLSDDIPVGESVDVAFETLAGGPGDATGAADDSGDYVTSSGTVTIEGQSGPDTAVVPITVTRDQLDEFDESVFLQVRNVDPSAPQFVLPGGAETLTVDGLIVDDDPLVVAGFASATAQVAEGGSTQLTVRLNRASGKAVTVAWATALDGSAAASDAPEQSGQVTIPAGGTSTTFDVVAADDAEDEDPETFSVSLSDPVNATLGTDRATVTINDDDLPVPTLTVEAGSVSEERSSVPLSAAPRVPVTFRLSTEPDRALEVGYTTGDSGTAVAGDDFVARTDVVRFEADETEKTIFIVVEDDLLDEDDETIAVEVVEPAGADLEGGDDEATYFATILDDDDPPTIRFADASVSRVVAEGESSTFTVQVTEPSGRDVEVAWRTEFDGTATAADLDAQSGTVRIPAGQTTGTFTVTTKQDDASEPDETLSVFLSDPVNAGIDPNRARARLTIADDEVVLPEITVTPGTGDESLGPIPQIGATTPVTFTIELDEVADTDVTVDVRTATGGTATAELDYTAVPRTTKTIPQGQTSVEVDVIVKSDDLDEFDETVRFLVSNASGARLAGGDAQLESFGTILDDDLPAQVSIADADVPEGEVATLEVTLDTASGKRIRVDYATADAASAAAGEDYTATSGSVVLEPGDTSATFGVPTLDDPDVEGDEELDVTITVADSDTAEVARGLATLTILDDDVLLEGVPVVSLSGASVEEGNPPPAPLPSLDPALLVFEVRLSEAATGDVVIDFRTDEGTATDGEDFDGRTGTLTIEEGDTSGTIEIPVTPDLVDEFDEQLDLVLTGVTPNAQLPRPDLTRRGRILNDDDLATVAFTAETADVGVGEGGSVDLVVELEGATAKEVTVDYATSYDGDASSADVPPQSGTLTFPAGTTTRTITIDTLDDDLEEPSESLSVVLSSPRNGALDDGRPTVATVTLVDDEIVLPVLTLEGGSVDEGAAGALGLLVPAQVAWGVTLSEPADEDVTVEWTTIDTGSAVAGKDFTARSGTLTIDAGETSGQISADVIDDELDEFDETVVVRLSQPTNAVLEGGGTRLDGPSTITDDDAPVFVDLGDDAEVAEGDAVSVEVSLRAESGKDVVVRLRTADGGATAGTDYRALDREVTIPAGQMSRTVSIRTIDDGVDEGDETLQVQLSLVEDDRAQLGRDVLTLTILDDDVAPVVPGVPVLLLTGDAVDEGDPLPGGIAALTGGTLEFVIGLSEPADTDVVVSYRTIDGTAVAGEDYEGVTGSVTIPAGGTEATVPVGVTADAIDEDDEEFVFQITSVSGDAQLPADGLERTGRILDDDPLPLVRIGDDAVLEGSTASFDVTLNRASGRDSAVFWSVREGTATRDDVGSSGGVIVFPAGTTSRTLSIDTVADGVAEGIEQLEIVLSRPLNVAIDDGVGTLTIVDLDVDGGGGPGGPGASAPAVVSVESVSADEGDSGPRTVRVPVTLLTESTTDTRVAWTSQRLTATPEEDYLAPGGEVVIPAGATSAQIEVTFLGDLDEEFDEDFLVLITESDAFVAGPTGRVTIVNDDPAGEGDGDGDGDGTDPDGETPGGSGTDGDGDLGAPDVDAGELPATGGGAALLGLAAVAGAAALRRRRDDT